jgi:hypothetical protein
MPIAAIVPKIVAANAAINPMMSVFHKALASEWWIPPWKIEAYSLSEKPVQLPKTLASVNEKIMIIRMGA